jgi:Anti-sigma factor NepR
MGDNKDDSSSGRRAIREQIDENLKRAYAAALSEEIPDRFKELLAELKSRGSTDPDNGTGEEK